MFLYANGDSFTWGDELGKIIAPEGFNKEQRDRWKKIADNRPPKIDDYWAGSVVVSDNEEYRLSHGWPGRLAKLLKCDGFDNDAFPGGSNERILRTTTDWILYNKKRHPNLFVSIGWTFHSRFELWNVEYNCYMQYTANKRNIHKSQKSFIDSYWRNTYNEYERISKYLHCVVTLQTLLKYYKIDFLFFNAIQDLDGLSKFDLSIFNHLLDQIDRVRYYCLDKGTFNTWDEERKYPRGPDFHPLAEGHAAWAKLLYEYINENGLCND